MQTVSSAFSAEESSSVRQIAHDFQVAWKKDFRSNITFFTIGVSRIGGSDIIPGAAGVQSAWNRYLYNDETDNVTNLSWERELNLPLGGLVKAQADVGLDNTSGRYTPYYAGGDSEIFTAVLPRRPMIINAGFEVSGADYTIPQFIGINDRQVEVDIRNATAKMHGFDFVDYLQNKYVDRTSMFTGQYSHQVIETLLTQAGFSTGQYTLDEGINRIGFGIFETGSKMGDIINKIAQAENAHFYQDEEGRLRFDNRQHWDVPPYTSVQRIITTAQVINSKVPDTTNIINAVEVVASPRDVVDEELVISTDDGGGLSVQTLQVGDTELWINYDDPMFVVTTPVQNGTVGQTSYYIANTASDASGTDVTANVTVKSIENFAQASKIVFSNASGSTAYLTTLEIWGRPARKIGDIYLRDTVSSSITAFEEHVLKVENDYIQDSTWAQTYATLIFQDFATPEKVLEITVRAIPELQMGDLISWQGRSWRVFGISSRLEPSVGFVQILKLVQRDIHTYFRIGISTIGGSDTIAP